MLRAQNARWLLLFIGVFAAFAAEVPRTPAQIYGDLFTAVQSQPVLDDNKTFVDMIPKGPPGAIVDRFHRERMEAGFDLRAFVLANFSPPSHPAVEYRSDPSQDVRAHIDSLWPILTRGPDPVVNGSSLLPLPHRYVVPGGRFVEMYYWDSYFTMLGLETSGRHGLVVEMVDDFAYLIDRYGHIPNGNRSYYLSRSQPPFFAAMVELVAEHGGATVYRKYLPQLEKEYAFWMEGAETLRAGSAHRRVVKLEDGTVLNRYWDDAATPREESYRHDLATAASTGRPKEETYRNLRAAAESGWDFSSRWFADGQHLATIRTVELAPIDLNSLLYHLERVLAKSYRAAGERAKAKELEQHASARQAAMRRLMWDAGRGIYVDYDWVHEQQSKAFTAASFYPLFFDVADDAQAKQTATRARKELLAEHGLNTSTVQTGEQWDAPNGWAPLQWIAIRGLRKHHQMELAETIARRWMAKNIQVYRATGKLLEKYDVTGDAAAGGGEYPLQDGFGWTNGVLRRLLVVYPAPNPARGTEHNDVALPAS